MPFQQSAMNNLAEADPSDFAAIRFVLTDMDETLTRKGRLAARTYQALERLQVAGLRVIPVTAAPAGWCDQMARMWPVDGVIAENGGVFIARSGSRSVERTYWHAPKERSGLSERLRAIKEQVAASVASASLSDDQPFRLTSIAFNRPRSEPECRALRSAFVDAGANVSCNDLWVLGWIGAYDKLSMACRVLAAEYDIDPEAARSVVAYCGDSENDLPMFEFFENSIGVSTVREHALPHLPRWITKGPGGEGFVEAADIIIRGCSQEV
jgi:hypothetical protein